MNTDISNLSSPPLPGGVVLRSEHVSFHYAPGQAAVDNVSTAFYSGELVMIVGPNGSGKSTFLRLLMGHITPHAGTISVHGRNLIHLHPLDRAALLSYVPQTPHVSVAYSVQEIVATGIWAHQRRAAGGTLPADDKSAMNRVVQAMWDMDVHAMAERTYDELSAGERQRVAIARALAQDAPIVLLDEPTAALDIRHQLELLDQLKALAHNRQKTVIWVTHDLNQARTHADRVVMMHEGKLAAQGKPDQVLTPEILQPIYHVQVILRDTQLVFSRFTTR